MLIFTIPSLILTGRSLIRGLLTFWWARERLLRSAGDFAWSHLSLADKLAFFNPWHVTSFIGGEAV